MSRPRLLFVACLCLAGSIGCSSYSVRPMPQVKASEAPAHTTWGAAHIAAKPYTQSAEIEAIFNNKDLMAKGVLPVLIIVDNTGSGSDIEILRSSIELASSSGSKLAPIGSESATNDQGRNPVAEAIFFFGIFSYDNANKYNEEMKRDWTEKALPEVTFVTGGRTVSKFVFFAVGRDYNPTGSTLNIPARVANSTLRQTISLRF